MHFPKYPKGGANDTRPNYDQRLRSLEAGGAHLDLVIQTGRMTCNASTQCRNFPFASHMQGRHSNPWGWYPVLKETQRGFGAFHSQLRLIKARAVRSQKKCHVLSSAESIFGKYFGILVAVSKRHSQKLRRGVCWPPWAFNTAAGTLGLEPAPRSGSVNDDTNARSLGNTFLPLSRFLNTELDQWQQGRTSRSFLITVKTLSSFFRFCSYGNKITQNQQNECTYIPGGVGSCSFLCDDQKNTTPRNLWWLHHWHMDAHRGRQFSPLLYRPQDTETHFLVLQNIPLT